MVGRKDSNAAAYAFSQWLAQAGNGTWQLGVNKTLTPGPTAKVVTGGSNVTDFLLKTPFSIGYASPSNPLWPVAVLATMGSEHVAHHTHAWELPLKDAGTGIALCRCTTGPYTFNQAASEDWRPVWRPVSPKYFTPGMLA